VLVFPHNQAKRVARPDRPLRCRLRRRRHRNGRWGSLDVGQQSQSGEDMPSISMFYGLIVYMYFVDNKQHKLPHIHVKYQDDEVVVQIPDGNVLEGSIPNSKMKLLQAWIELHQDELMADWALAVSGEQPYKIDPLR
jgi:hypothetical protein